MEIRFVHKPLQDEKTPIEERQYGDAKWCVHISRNKIGETHFKDILLRLEEEIKYRIEKGDALELGIYLYDIIPMYQEHSEGDFHMNIYFRYDYIKK